MSDALLSSASTTAGLAGGRTGLGVLARNQDRGVIVCDIQLRDLLATRLRETESDLAFYEEIYADGRSNAAWAAGLARVSMACRIFVFLGKMSAAGLDKRLKVNVFGTLFDAAESLRAGIDGNGLKAVAKLGDGLGRNKVPLGLMGHAVKLTYRLSKVREAVVRLMRYPSDMTAVMTGMAQLSLEMKALALDLSNALSAEAKSSQFRAYKDVLKVLLDFTAMVEGLRSDLHALEQMGRENPAREAAQRETLLRLKADRRRVKAYLDLMNGVCASSPPLPRILP